MDGKDKTGGFAAVIVSVGLLALIGVICLAVVSAYLEFRASKQVSRERMERVMRQMEERERASRPTNDISN
jgi:hypothetical protein